MSLGKEGGYDEKIAYQAIIDLKKAAVAQLNIETLEQIPELFSAFATKVETRIKEEALQKEYDDKRTDFLAIVLHESANDEERQQFENLQNEINTAIDTHAGFEQINAYLKR